MAKKSIFISSDLEETGPLLQWAKKSGHEVHGQGLIQFESIPFELPPFFDILVFYSKNGVNYFFQQLDEAQTNRVKQLKFGSIGLSTAAQVEEVFQKKVSYIFDDIKEKSTEYNDKLAGKVCIYPQAQTSRKTIEKALTSTINIPIVVYKNIPKNDFILPFTPHIIVFTSPLSVDAFMSSNDITDNQILLSIGNTTAKYMEENYGLTCQIAEEPNEIGLLNKIISLVE